MKIIKDLKINDSLYKFLDDDNKKLCGLSRVNIFVGKNNSGKSRFLRSIFYDKNNLKLEFIPDDNDFNEYLSRLYKLKNDLNDQKIGPKSSREFNKNYNKIKKIIEFNDYVLESESHCKSLSELYNDYQIRPRENSFLVGILNKYFEYSNMFLDNNLFKYNFYKVYIPSLRGLLPFIPEQQINASYNDSHSIFDYVKEDVFAQRVKLDYFGENANIIADINDSFYSRDSRNSIITGHYFYKYVQQFLLGDLEQRDIIKDYQEYLSENFFEGEDVALIPKLEDDVLTVKIGDENEQKIYNLGEGIQSIILITLPLFLYLNKAKESNTNILVFIEEPEIGLHPSLQRKLLEIFLDDRFENYQFFFTTHSNHFIDRTFEGKDISIYSFDKNIIEENELSFNIENVSFNHLPTLDKLGALPSAVLMSNCVILVEGSWDIEHYKFYLDLYQKYLKESNPDTPEFIDGIHYSFLRGGGSEADKTLKDWNIKDRLFYIVDADNEEKKRKKENKFDELNFTNYHILEVYEVENLISKDVLINILNNMEQFKEFEVNESFDIEEYKHSSFYNFIGEKILNCDNLEKYMKKPYMKKQLVKKQKDLISNYDDLTTEAKHVVEEMYGFIQSRNPI